MLKATRKEWGRHRKLLQDPDVKRWYDNIARGSIITADVRLRRRDIEAKYTTNKHKLADSLIKDMRVAYERSQNFLSPFDQSEIRRVLQEYKIKTR